MKLKMPVSEMTEKEILRQQLELLAEQSMDSTHNAEGLATLTSAMCEVMRTVDQIFVLHQ